MGTCESPQQDCILAIDDDPEVLALVRAALAVAGYVVYTTSSANDGVKLYETHWREIKLVVLDYMMPDMTGDVVLGCLRLVNPNVRTLLLTGFGDEVFGKMLGPEVCGRLNKPFSLPDFTLKVQDAVSLPTLAS